MIKLINFVNKFCNGFILTKTKENGMDYFQNLPRICFTKEISMAYF